MSEGMVMKKHVLASIVVLLAALGWSAGTVAANEKLYSIQVRAVPMAERADGMATYRALRDKGYLVYAYKAEIDGKPWLRVAVGAFDSNDDAAVFGESFSAKEEQDHFVAVAPVRITAADGGDFVVTPSALWTRAGGRVREVLAFSDPAPRGFAAPGGIRLKPSPDGKAVAFQYGTRVYAAHLGDDDAKRLSGDREFPAEHIYGPEPHWSPSGRYVAFHDFLEPEVNTGLWVARADGSELRQLVDYAQYAVRGFVWHPTEDRVFFVKSSSLGMVSVGGPIQSLNMDGTIKTVLDQDKEAYQELAGPLKIKDGYLHYRRAQFDDNWVIQTYTDERTPLSDL
jgi:hypothetical protein